jgi:hypothetical protein
MSWPEHPTGAYAAASSAKPSFHRLRLDCKAAGRTRVAPEIRAAGRPVGAASVNCSRMAVPPEIPVPFVGIRIMRGSFCAFDGAPAP